MVQEFHVLRCYSCQTFQVQQVKKSTKWNCKMCGEKQSVIKEFGRGSGVDCRRHVQKLNARRGETLVEQDQKALSHWEEVGSEAGEDCEDRPQDHDQQDVCSKVEEPCRWGKYLDKPGEGQADEEEEEEENVFMDRNQIHGNINVGKRKRTQNGGNRYHCGDKDTMAAPSWRTAKLAKQTRHSSSFTPVEESHEAPASRRPMSGYLPPTSFTSSKPPPTSFTSSKPPPTSFTSSKPSSTAAPKQLNVVTFSHLKSSGSTTISKASKWSQYMSAPSCQDEEESEGESCWMSRDEAGNIEPDVDRRNNDGVTLSCEQPTCSGISAVGLGSVFLKKSVVGVAYSRLKSTLSHCGFGEETNSKRDPSLTRMSPECTEPIREQPKPPGPSLVVGSLFNTGEDFDDTFDLDDLKVEPTHTQGII